MTDIVLFGGTGEGRALAEALQKKGVPTLACVATEYGESLLCPGGSLRTHTGRLDQPGMLALFALECPRLVLDATHPYAAEVSRNIRAACEGAHAAYLRVRRLESPAEGCVPFDRMDTLCAWLNAQPGVIFSALGAKEAAALSRVQGARERIYLRVLPAREGLAACLLAGFPAKHIICMPGPFSKELNAAMFHEAGADILATKESGRAGGFPEKLAAARECGMRVALLRRPQEPDGIALEELLARIEGETL